MFKKYGFSLTKNYNYLNLSLFLEFQRDDSLCDLSQHHYICNTEIVPYVFKYINDNQRIVKKLNEYMHNSINKSYYIWPASVHSIPLFTYGLNFNKLSGILDNSPNKIGKYITTYKLKCSSLNYLLQTCEYDTVIFIANAGPYVKEIHFFNSRATILFLCDL